MKKSIDARLAELERVVEAQAAAQVEVPLILDLVCAETREEAQALQALAPTPAPNIPRGTIHLDPRFLTAEEYLAGIGMAAPDNDVDQ